MINTRSNPYTSRGSYRPSSFGSGLDPHSRLFSNSTWKPYFFYGFLALLVFLFIYTASVFVSYFWNRAQIGQDLEEYRQWVYGTGTRQKAPPIKIYAANGALLGEYLPERGSWITMSACSELKWLKAATIAAEDQEFYSHGGVSYKGILRAAWRNLRSFALREGGGTLTQQLARNLFTGRERSFYRKLYETLIAFQMEGQLTKEEILCLYLNKIYMGEGRIGAEEASWFYFQKPPWKLDAAEAAMIVGLFPSPVYYSPLNNIELSLMKQNYVLEQLVKNERLQSSEAKRAMRNFLKNYEIKTGEMPGPGRVGLYGASRDFRFNIAPAVNEYVKKFLYESLPEDLILEGGIQVYTTIEPKRQALSLQMMRTQIYSLRQTMLKQNYRVEPEKLSKWVERLNGAFVALDAKDAKILAVVGGYSITEGSMTQRIWSMLRQPGSSIKGFLYASAIDEKNLHLNSMVVDEPFEMGDYKPRNWNNKYLGQVPLARAMAMSINTVAVKTLRDMGIAAFRGRLAQALDLKVFEKQERFPNNLSLALGSGELSPLELAQLYASLVNGGYFVRPYLITRIEDHKSQVLWEKPSDSTPAEPFLSPEACAGALKLMEFVFDPDLEGTAEFIGKRRRRDPNYLPFPIAGKTGTVQIPEQHKERYRGMSGVRDAWFVGIVPQELAVLWFGQDEGVPIPGSGSRAAAAWASYAQQALLGSKLGETFPETEDINENTEASAEQEQLEEETKEGMPPVESNLPVTQTKEKADQQIQAQKEETQNSLYSKKTEANENIQNPQTNYVDRVENKSREKSSESESQISPPKTESNSSESYE